MVELNRYLAKLLVAVRGESPDSENSRHVSGVKLLDGMALPEPLVDDSKSFLSRLPNLQRLAAVLLILLQNYSLELLIAPNSTPILWLALLGALAPLFRLQIQVHPLVGILPISIYAIYRARNYSHNLEEMGFIDSEVAFEMANGCFLIQIFLLFLKQYERRLPVGMLLLASIGMVFAGDIRVAVPLRDRMLLVNLVFLILWLLFASGLRNILPRRSRKGGSARWLLIAFLLVGTGLSSQALAKWLYSNDNHLERLIGRLLTARNSHEVRRGFSGTGGLHDVSGMQFDQGRSITLSIRSQEMPGYLRGATFDYFTNNRWLETSLARNIPSITSPQQSDHSEYWEFRIQAPEGEPVIKEMEIFSFDRKVTHHFFTPLETLHFWSPGPMLKVHGSLALEGYPDDGHSSYRLEYGPVGRVSQELIDPKYLQIPAGLNPFVPDLARSLKDPALSPSEQMQKVASFFNREFKYGIGYEGFRVADQLGLFLINRIPMHCEYFATATAIILRLQGIPTRYVTGYHVTENQQGPDHWVARRRDAHAWVEAFDRESGTWRIVESTPADGMNFEQPEGYFQDLYDWYLVKYRLLSEKMMQDRFRDAVLETVWRVMLGFFLLISLILVIRGLLKLRLARSRLPVEFVGLIRERARFDRFLSRRGLVRGQSEPVTKFADRIESFSGLLNSRDIAGWYRRYGELRFGGQVDKPESKVSQFRSERQQMMRATRRKV